MKYTIRIGTPEDAELLSDVRIRQLLDEGSAMRYDARDDLIDYFRRTIADGSYVPYIADQDGDLIATAAILFQEYPPSIGWPGARRGYIASVYTRPDCRGQGLASVLIRRIMADVKDMGLGNLWLMASEQGKSVYQKLGFDDKRPGRDIYMEWIPEG